MEHNLFVNFAIKSLIIAKIAVNRENLGGGNFFLQGETGAWGLAWEILLNEGAKPLGGSKIKGCRDPFRHYDTSL